jgi:hypothetical protein
MPCTQNDEQDQQGAQGASVRSTFRRNFAALRATYQQSVQGFALQPSHHQHHGHNHHHHYHHHHSHPHPNAIVQNPVQSHPHAIMNNGDDLTEQIRISVQDTHISHGSFANELGGNISDVLDSFDEESIISYRNNQSQQEYAISNHNSTDLVRSSIPSNSQFIHQSSHYVSPAPSSSSASSSSSSRVDICSNQSSSSVTSQSRAAEVRDTKDRNNMETTTQPSTEKQKSTFSRPSGVKHIDNQETTGSNSVHQTDDNQIKSTSIEVSTCGDETKRVVVVEPATNSVDCTRYPHDESKQSIIFHEDLQHKFNIFEFAPSCTKNHQVGVIKNYLFNGSSFSGYQKSKNESYEVNVKIQHVDYNSSYLCGYLCIAHLTKSHPSLTTFFEGEIISNRYPFLTRKWEATEEIDRAHWSKFEEFSEKYSKNFNLDSFDHDVLKDSDCIYMRWKEHFLVPDHTVKYVEGASYAGFYYICYSKRTSQIKGYYFHINSEHFER